MPSICILQKCKFQFPTKKMSAGDNQMPIAANGARWSHAADEVSGMVVFEVLRFEKGIDVDE